MSRLLSYDPACEDLARHFLNGEGVYQDTPENRASLARELQRTVEDWKPEPVAPAEGK